MIIRHSRNYTAAGSLQSLRSSVVSGLTPMNQTTGDLADRNHPDMACQSLHQRSDIRSTAFLMAVPCDLVQQRYSTAAKRTCANSAADTITQVATISQFAQGKTC